MAYRINTTYLEHSGGTKFYETVLISEEDGGPSMLIKRYGPIGSKMGGGQFILERGTWASTARDERKILNEKTKRGYSNAPLLGLGMHAVGGQADTSDLIRAVNNHYPTKERGAIKDYFGITGASDNPVINEEPDPEPPEAADIDPTWGTW